MNYSKFKGAWDRTVIQNITLRFVIAAQTVTVVLLSTVIMYLYNRQKVVFVPPAIDREFWLAGESMSKSYLEMMGEFLADKVMNVTESNVVARFNSLLPFVSSGNYNEIKVSLLKQADAIASNKISQTFYHSGTYIDEQTKTIAVFGGIRQMISDEVTNKKFAILWLKYRVKSGRFEIEDIQVTQENKNPYNNQLPIKTK